MAKRTLYRNPRTQPIDEHGVTELVLYTENDSYLWNRRAPEYAKNLATKIKRGKYDATQAVKLLEYLTREAATRYDKEFGTRGVHTFSPATRKAAAEALLPSVVETAEQMLASGSVRNPRRNPTGSKLTKLDFRPRTRTGYYKRGNDVIYVEAVDAFRNGDRPLGVADWYVSYLGSLTAVGKMGPSLSTQAASGEMMLYEFISSGYKRVTPEKLSDSWRNWFAYHLKGRNPSSGAKQRARLPHGIVRHYAKEGPYEYEGQRHMVLHGPMPSGRIGARAAESAASLRRRHAKLMKGGEEGALEAELLGGLPALKKQHAYYIERSKAHRPSLPNPSYKRRNPSAHLLGKGDVLAVMGRLWRDKTYGNTYFTATINVNGEVVAELPISYGYGNQYMEAAGAWLDKHGYTKRPTHKMSGPESLWRYCDDHGIKLLYEATSVKRKKDL